ncbi:hypothetical protein HaLaN_16228 [Haematococcus lacustris]|uniref:Uncharacterized protein n=1 Tax=Haematococcus lacustris TaxID=44745 RepID=A0A699ZD45_HAELA|nr:hypothetical protein HaLaN_16228 [Haematococcus lacustris]
MDLAVVRGAAAA